MKKKMSLNFYNFLKVEFPENLKLDYFKEFISENSINTDYVLKLTETKSFDKTNHVLVSVYLSYDSDKREIFLIDKNGFYCQSIFGKLNKKETELKYEVGFNPEEIISYIIKPYLRNIFTNNGFAFIHASSFTFGEDATLIAAWAHTGKTNTLITNILKGAEYLGDDLSIVSEFGEIKPFPVPINLFYYNLRDIPEIRKKIGIQNKIKFFFTRKIAGIFKYFNRISKSPKMKYLFYAGKVFFDSASHVPYYVPYGYNLNDSKIKFFVKNVFLLERVTEINKSPVSLLIEPDLFAQRMQECINYEFQRFNELVTSAKWVPFYNGDDISENKEFAIYKSFASKNKIYNILIPQKFDFKFIDLQDNDAINKLKK